MTEAEFHKLLTAAQRRSLSPAEQAAADAWLTAHPAARASWDDEVRLTRLLGQLPDCPVASNFAAQVLRAVPAPAPAPERSWWRGFGGWPQTAAAALVMVAAGFSLAQYRAANRARFAESVALVSGVAGQPSVETLADFESIRRLEAVPARPPATGQRWSPAADVEFMALLQ